MTPAGHEASGFLGVAEPSPAAQRLFAEDLAEVGYVVNASRLWAHQAAAHESLFDLLGRTAEAAGLSLRQRGILVTACASTRGDAYCALAWGVKLADEAGGELAAAVLRGNDGLLDPTERALAGWARQVAGDPNGSSAEDLRPLRDAGYDDAQVLAITMFVGLRMAFSAVNDALGAHPDQPLADAAPAAVLAAVTYGRPVASAPSPPDRGPRGGPALEA